MVASRKPHMKGPPPPEGRLALPVEMTFTVAQFAKLAEGSYGEKGDPWTIIHEEPWLYFIRPEGQCWMGVRFERERSEYRVAEAWVRRDERMTGTEWFRQFGVRSQAAYLKTALFRMAKPGQEPPREWLEELARAPMDPDPDKRTRG